jgi:hypothetical protein
MFVPSIDNQGSADLEPVVKRWAMACLDAP